MINENINFANRYLTIGEITYKLFLLMYLGAVKNSLRVSAFSVRKNRTQSVKNRQTVRIIHLWRLRTVNLTGRNKRLNKILQDGHLFKNPWHED